MPPAEPHKIAAVRIGVPREVEPGERRVALVPEAVSKLLGSGFGVVVERAAGRCRQSPIFRERDVSLGPELSTRLGVPVTIDSDGYSIDVHTFGGRHQTFLAAPVHHEDTKDTRP